MKAGLNSLILSAVAIGAIIGLACPAQAQFMGTDSRESKVVTTTEHRSAASQASQTSSATYDSVSDWSGNASKGPNAENNASVAAEVNTSGTVRVNMLANLEAVVNIGANGVQIICMIWGAVLMYACSKKIGKQNRVQAFAFALLPFAFGLCTNASVNWAIAACRDANLFS